MPVVLGGDVTVECGNIAELAFQHRAG